MVAIPPPSLPDTEPPAIPTRGPARSAAGAARMPPNVYDPGERSLSSWAICGAG